MAKIIKNETGGPIDIELYGLRVADGQAFEIPDEDASFDNRPGFTSSQRKTADVTPDLLLVEAATAAPVPTVPVEN